MKIAIALVLAVAASAQQPTAHRVDSMEGLWRGYDGEWGHVSRQLLALAETIPADKYGWAPGARREIYERSHHAHRDCELLAVECDQPANALGPDLERAREIRYRKARVIKWLRRSLDAVKAGRANLKPGDRSHQ